MTAGMKYWLMKSEPDVFGIDDLERAPGRTTGWEGVRNYQVRNMLRDDFGVGDRAFFYHSSCAVPGVAGIVQVVRAAYADPTQFDAKSEYHDAASTRAAPRWFAVDVAWAIAGGLAIGAGLGALIGRLVLHLRTVHRLSIGLDEFSVGQRATGTGVDAVEGQVVTVGKRLTDRLYIAYDQGLTIATNALRIEYVLSRFFTVSAFTGTTSGVALNFRRNWR